MEDIKIKSSDYEKMRLAISHYIIKLDRHPDNQDKVSEYTKLFHNLSEKIIQSGLQEISGLVKITGDEAGDKIKIRKITGLTYENCKKVLERYTDELADKS